MDIFRAKRNPLSDAFGFHPCSVAISDAVQNNHATELPRIASFTSTFTFVHYTFFQKEIEKGVVANKRSI